MSSFTIQDVNVYTTYLKHEEMTDIMKYVDNMISEIGRPQRSELLCNKFQSYDKATFIHSINVTILTLFLAKMMGYCEKGLKEIAWGALLHDLGKLKVPKSILNKPGKLTEDEYELMKRHPRDGVKLLESFSLSKASLLPIIQHHERWGGTGYPLGLKAEEIHPNARIVAVADVFAALTADRPYRRGMKIDQALKIVKAGKGKDFSPAVVDPLVKLFSCG